MTKKFITNLLKQNCYVIETCSLCNSLPEKSGERTYVDIEERTIDDGVKLIKTYQTNPVCPDYVKSFSEGCNYKVDPLASVLSGSAHWATKEDSVLAALRGKSDTEIRAYFEDLFNRLPKVSPSTEDNKTDTEKNIDTEKNKGEKINE